MNRSLRIMIAISSVILIGTAIFHGTGYSSLRSSIVSSSLPNFFVRAIPGIWMFFSWHLIAIAAAAAWISIRASQNARPLLVFCAIVTSVDAIYVLALAGVFPGTILLFAAAALLVASAFRWHSGNS